MGTLGDVPDVDIEQLVPMVLDESKVDGMIPLEGTSRVSGNVDISNSISVKLRYFIGSILSPWILTVQ